MSLLLCTARSISFRRSRLFNLLREQPLASDFRQRRGGKPIARRLDDDDAAAGTPGFGETRRDLVRLPQGELTASRAKSKRLKGPHAGSARPAAFRPREFLDAPLDPFDTLGVNGEHRRTVDELRAP